MLLHGIRSAVADKTKHRPVKLKNIQTICILMCSLTIPEIAHAAKFEYKAVFSAPCVDLMTLSTPVPELTQFTVCTYIKLASSNPWTAFTYQLPASPNVYEFGVLGDSSSLKIWMFGTQINVIESLNLHTWYEICILWNSEDESMGFYLDGAIKVNRKLEHKTKLDGGGSLVLGCSNFKEANASVSVGLVGEMYMFRMWSTSQTSHFQNCNDGNVVKWKIDDWIYTPKVVQQDSYLHCAKEQEASSPGQINSNIHMFHKRSIKVRDLSAIDLGSSSTKGPTTAVKTLTSGFSALSTAENTNTTNATGYTISTSKSNILWTSVNRTASNGNDTFLTTSTFSTSSVTTDINNVSNNQTLTVPSSTVAAGSMNCSFTETSAFQTWKADFCNATCYNSSGHMDICNATCYNGSVYELILEDNCTIVKGILNILLNTTYLYTNMDTCNSFVFGVNDTVICGLWSRNPLYTKSIQNIKSIHKIDYYCCCNEVCSFPDCTVSSLTCPTSSSGGGDYTPGFQSPTQGNSGLTVYKNGTSMTVYSGSSTTSTKGFSTTSNNGSTLNIVSDTSVVTGTSTIFDTIQSEVTLTTNSKSDNTISKSTSTNNDESTTSVKSEISTTGDKGTMTTKKPNGTVIKESSTTVSHGPTGTTGSQFNSTVNISPMSTINNGSNTTNNGPTENSTHNTTVTTGPASTYNVTITSVSSSTTFTIILPNISDLNNASVVNSSVSLLENYTSGEVSTETANALLGFLDSLLNVPQTILGPLSNRLIKVVDKIGLHLTFPGESIPLTSKSLALAVNKVNASSFTGTSFGVNSSSGLQVSLGSQANPNSDGSVLLPGSLLKDLSAGDIKDASRVQFNYYAKTSFFQDSFLTEKKLVSKVISSSVANLSVTNLTDYITVTLKTSLENQTDGVECVFWDFNKNNGNGGWSSYGCLVANTTRSETVCKCNHLTSFAILMNVSPNEQLSPKDLLVLTFITYIGCGLSAMFLSVTLVTYIAFEKIRRDYPSKILIQLCAALVCLNLTFLLNPWIALYNEIPGLCISVAAFLHYFVLVSITWMGLEAFHMYLSLVKVFNTYVQKYILKFCIIGWGVPAVVVAIILAVNHKLYLLKRSGTYPNGSADYICWMDDIVFWITVVGYFGIIFLLNVSMFVVVLIQLCRIKRQKQLGYQRKTTFQDLRSVSGITFLLGITWGLGFFAFGPGRTAIMYLFTIFNTLQGFFIFFFYCVAKENVRKQWRRYLCCGRFRLAENSDWSKTAANKLRKQTSKQGPSSSSSNSIQSTSHTNSSTLLVANEYSLHPNGNGNVYKEKNGVTFMPQNGEMPLQEFVGRPSTNNGDVQQNTLRRTSNRGSVHFVDQM